METMDAIRSRRSIRKYTEETVPENVINELLEAAMCAPSARNERPWHFIVVHDRQILDEIASVSPTASSLRNAPVAIAVCCDLELASSGEFWVQDCAAAMENILIAAVAEGLGAVWLGVYPREERVAAVSKVLGLPNHIVPLSLASIGYPAEGKPAANRLDPSRIHQNKW